MGILKNIFRKKKNTIATPKPEKVKIEDVLVKETSVAKEEYYGIEKEKAHERAIELVPEDFFWNCTDDLAPFGSDEGDMALSEFRDWKKSNPNAKTYECLRWTIEGVSERSVAE